jgi:putative ABC transport system permease protein
MRGMSWLKRKTWERRMDTELKFHLESQIDEYVRRGFSRDEAEWQARRDFGSLDLAKDECRDEKPAVWLDHIRRDLRGALRSLRMAPGFSAAVLVTLALGIGANTAIFSVVYAVLIKPLPYSEPEEIYAAEIVFPERRSQLPSLPVTVTTYLEWRSAETAFAEMTVLRPWEANVTGGAEPERLGGARVAANFFSFLGAPIKHGRSFSADEEQPGNERVVVISEELWQRRFRADPALVGSSIDINGEPHIVVGIASAGLLVPTGSQLHPLVPFAPRIDIWKPIAPTPRELKNESWDHGLLVRLRKGERLDRGGRQLEGLLNAQIRAQRPGMKTTAIVQFVPVREIYSGRVRLRLLLILATSALLLVMACTNVASLFLARVARRSGELATRIALGAGRARIISQTLTETMLLAALGGAIGFVVAHYSTALLASLAPADVTQLADARPNVAVLAFAILISLLTGIACGIFPAWQASRKDVIAGLHEAGRSTRGGARATGFRQILMGIEVALGTALLACAALLLHSFVKVWDVDRGYQIERVLAADVSLFGERYSTGASRAAFYRAITDNVAGLPGVVASGAISELPATSGSSGASRPIFYDTDTNFQQTVLARPVAIIRSVTAGYFAASGSSLQAGRPFAHEEPTPVALMSELLATRLWPGDPATAIVGRTFRHDVKGPLITVVGVVEDARSGALDREPAAILYRPYSQWSSGPMTLVVRTSRVPETLARAIRAEIRKIDPNVSVTPIRTMRDIVSASVAERRFQLVLTMVFAVLALLLGAVGLYGVVSYAVACQTRDIGMQMALGAMRHDVMKRVIAKGMRPVFAGLGAGLLAAVAIASAARSVIFGISPADPLSLGAVAGILLLTSAVACYLPARRAAAMNPMMALRHD